MVKSFLSNQEPVRQPSLSQYPPERSAKKIAVLRASAIGDYIFSLPALQALRITYPEAEITLLGQHWHHGFLSGRPGPVDRVVVIPPTRGVGKPEDYEENKEELEDFFASISTEYFDIAIQMHGGGRYSNPFLKHLNTGLTVGLKTPDAELLDRWLPYFYWEHEIIRNLEIVGLVGAAPFTLEPHLQLTERDLADSYQVVPEDGGLVVLHPGSSDPRRRWPPENFARVGDALAQTGAHVLVTGIEAECEVVEAVIASMSTQALNLCGKLSLEGLAGLLSRCRVVVSNDSGPVHLAAAVGTATVGIYWFGNMINASPITRRLHRPAISWRTLCPVCSRNTLTNPCEHRESFVADVTVQEVLGSAFQLIGL